MSQIIVSKLVKENLNKWDELSPLKDDQVKSILMLNQSNQLKHTESIQESFETDKTDQTSGEESKKTILLDVNEEVNDLLYNFDVNDIEDPRIEKYVHNLTDNSKRCSQISESIGGALNHLDILLENYSQVSAKTRSLHVACEQLISDQTKLVNASYLLNARLSYFTDMDVFMQKLNSPIVENNCEYVIPMLTRIDECLKYLETNLSHKESANYLQVVIQVLQKALQIIRNYTINTLTQATNSIIQSIQSSPNPVINFSEDNSYTTFYSKFRVNSNRIKTLMEQLEQRVELNKQPDYEQALADCQRCYIQQRRSLILTSVSNAINEFVQKHQRDTCALVRSSCSFMIHLCQDENQLYNQFFSKPSVHFERFLDELCVILYDCLRPIIIHVNHIETLAELCSILKTEILMDNVQKNVDNLTAFETVFSQLLEDVQMRFVYRTHIYIKDEILNYNPSGGDLSYPEKLIIMKQIADSLKEKKETEKPVLDVKQDISPADAHGMWFPTLKRTLICLSKLYRCLEKKIFEGLAQETLIMCVQSLTKASELIAKKKTSNDGELFLIKHLLILREQIAPFNNEFSSVEFQLDFTKIKDAAYGLMSKKAKMFQMNRDNAFLDFLFTGTLEAKENYVDSKREIDTTLKRTFEVFIESSSEDLFGTVKQLVIKLQTIVQMGTESNKVDMKEQPFAKPEKLQDIIAENYKDIKKKLPLINNAISLYLGNKDVELIILKRIKNNMQQTYLDMNQIVSKNYSEEDQQIIACPTSEQISLWMTV